MSVQYYHPEMNKTITIQDPDFGGGHSTITETNGDRHTQTLQMRPDEVSHFVEGLLSNGWLKRQQL